mmetsp:Transcript_32129/g.80657  ORF Transcript_32129/g.80657 Transcript_32129/m.80657 type:complete len:539 (+) Transcript_32129:78-1694(+)
MSAESTSTSYEELFAGEDAPAVPHLAFDHWLCNGELRKWEGESCVAYSPIFKQGAAKTQTVIGSFPMQTEKEALEALDAACAAFDQGKGVWPRLNVATRIGYMERFLEALRTRRDQIVDLIMWEICKTSDDAAKEVDRTIIYIQDTIDELKRMENRSSTFTQVGGVMAQIRRCPYGVAVICSPFNYPFNESYATMIPALIMGNTVVMKLPRLGVLCHYPTLELFREIFPPGVINVISGSGRSTLPPIMKSGRVDILAFIGTSRAASALQTAHPNPHRLRACLGLEAKNAAFVLPSADLKVAVEQCLLGSLSYNGQRCTAIKMIMVHESIAEQFVERFCSAVDALKMGMPWSAGVKITPLPEPDKTKYLSELIADAEAKGAKVVNKRGATVDRTLFAPAVLYPANKEMRIFHEEQFGPVVPITTYREEQEIFDYLAASQYGQQCAVFSQDAKAVGSLLDVLVNMVARVNLNSQCQRGPDVLPFGGRKDSAYGTLSVYDALRTFSIRSIFAAAQNDSNEEIVSQILRERGSNFLRMDYMF